MKPHIEEWKSSNCDEEIHYFSSEDQEYYFGYNPKIIPKELIKPLIKFVEKMIEFQERTK